MIRMLLLIFLTVGLVGCGSISHPLPKCDGYSRRPLNRSMWQWQDRDSGATKQPTTGAVAAEPTSHAAAYVQEPPPAMSAAFARFDVAGSYRPCEDR